MSVKEIFEKDRKAFDKFESRDWLRYYDSLNAEKTVEECGLELSESEKACYNEALAKLKRERERCPAVSYEIKYSWID